MPNYTFIATDERGVVKKDDNKLIRSSCMRGKNERHDSRRVKRRTKRYTSRSTKPQASVNGTQDEDEDGFVDMVDIPAANTLGAVLAAKVIGTPLTEAYVSDASLYSFIDKVDRHSREILFKYLSYSVSIDLLYPVGKCLKYPPIDSFLLLMAKSQPLLDLTLLVTHSIHDFVLQRRPSVPTITHLRKTIAHLNALITRQPSEQDIFTIVFLALGLGNMAAMFGDYSATSAHIQGLQRIATIQGGKEHLERFPKFSFKISRLDLSYSLCTGNKPVWNNLNTSAQPSYWHPYFSGSQPLPPHLHSVLDDPSISPFATTNTIFPKFTVVYNDMRHFVNLVNANVAGGTHMDTEMFHQSIHSIQARLIELDGKLSDHVAECVRLGMLALLTTTFRLPGPKMGYTYLEKCLKEKLVNVWPETESARKMLFWVLMMSVVAVFEVGEEWIGDIWRRVRGEERRWEVVRGELRAALWIGFIHDEPGQVVFEKLESKWGGLQSGVA